MNNIVSSLNIKFLINPMKHLSKTQFLIDSEKDTIYDKDNTGFQNLTGLFSCYQGVVRIANEIRNIEADKFVESEMKTGILEFDGNNLFVQNYFYWFSTSLTNYLRLVFFIEYTNKNKWCLNDLESSNNEKSLKTNSVLND